MTSRSAKTLIVAMASVLVLAGLVALYRARQARERWRPVKEAMATFRGCMYGKPLAGDEKPSERLRAMELCETQPEDWPARCMVHLNRADRAFAGLGITEEHPALGRAKKLMRIALAWDEQDFPWLAGVEAPTIDALEEGLAEGNLGPNGSESDAERCTAHTELTAKDVVSLGAASRELAATEDVHDNALRVLWGGVDQGVACLFSSEGAATARCQTADVHLIASVLSSDDGAKQLVAWDFRSGREKPYVLVDALTNRSLLESEHLDKNAWARADGTQIAFGPGGLVRVENETMTKLHAPAGVGWAALVPGWLLWAAEAEGTLEISGARWDAEAGSFADKIVTIGTVPGRPVVRGCRDERRALVLTMVSAKRKLAKTSPLNDVNVRVAFPNDAGDFAPLVQGRANMPGSELMEAVPDGAATFGCKTDGSPRWVWLHQGRVHALSCSRAGCSEKVSEKLSVGQMRLLKVAVAPVGSDDVLLAYAGERRGTVQKLLHSIRYRRAPVASIASVPARVLIADQHYDGLEGLWQGVFAFGRGQTGWVAVRAQDHLYAFRTVADRLEPVKPVAN